jgi:hypothetical protein
MSTNGTLRPGARAACRSELGKRCDERNCCDATCQMRWRPTGYPDPRPRCKPLAELAL